MVCQDAGASLTPWVSAGTQIAERLRGAGLNAAARRQRVTDALAHVGLPAEVASARAGQLSGGQRQRVALARATVIPPEVLLCDEPTSALDVSLAAGVLNLIGRLRRELGMAVLFVTHDLSVARGVADRIAVMYLGRIVELGAADEIVARPRHPYTKAPVSAARVPVAAWLARLPAPHDPIQPVGLPQLPPGSSGFLLGTDSIGRDILSRVLIGWQSSWFAALAVIASGLLIGGLIGLIAGMRGGLVDTFLMRITDGFLALPAPVLAIAVVAALGPGFLHTLIAVAVLWWPFYARIVRGEIRSLAARPHVEAARLAGVGPPRSAFPHLLPGPRPPALRTPAPHGGNP